MDEYQLLGAVISAIIALGGFITLVFKFTQPVNDLRIAIQKLSDSIDSMRQSADRHEEAIDTHGHQIHKLDNRITTIEKLISVYHKDESR